MHPPTMTKAQEDANRKSEEAARKITALTQESLKVQQDNQKKIAELLAKTEEAKRERPKAPASSSSLPPVTSLPTCDVSNPWLPCDRMVMMRGLTWLWGVTTVPAMWKT